MNTKQKKKKKRGMKREEKQKIISSEREGLIGYCGSSNKQEKNRKVSPQNQKTGHAVYHRAQWTNGELMVTKKIRVCLQLPVVPHVIHHYEPVQYCTISFYFLIT